MRKKPKAFPPHFEKAKMCSKVMLYADRFYTSLQDSTRISKCSKDIINRVAKRSVSVQMQGQQQHFPK